MRPLAALAGALALFAGAPAHAYEIDENAEVWGYAQFWFTVLEQMEDARGLYQHPSRDEATDSTTGFSLSRARVGLRLRAPGLALQLKTSVKLERDFALLDLSVAWTPRPGLSIEFGQLKIPGTFEALTDNRELGFIVRSAISTRLADYALSRTAHSASLLYGGASNLRDLGLAVRGELGLGPAFARLFAFVGNGLGANLFFGGDTRREYLVTNGPQLFGAARLEVGDAGRRVVLGGQASRNQHDNVVYNSGRVVYDLSRRTGSVDLQARVPGTGLRAAGIWGAGVIRDDFNGDGRTDLRYSGWAAMALWDLVPLLQATLGAGPPVTRALELAFRADRFTSEIDESGVRLQQTDYTVGVNWLLERHLKLQLNYVMKRTEDPSLPDLDDDILFANLQGAF